MIPSEKGQGLKLFGLIVVFGLLLASIYYFVDSRAEDPFADMEPQSFGTSGKVLSVGDKSLTMSAAVSTIKNGITYITYEDRKILTDNFTKIFRKAGTLKEPAVFDDIQVNYQIDVVTSVSPNSNEKFLATEIVIY